MAKKEKQKEFRFLPADEFTVIEGNYVGFKKGKESHAIAVETETEVLGISLNAVLLGAVKTAYTKNLFVHNVPIKLVKGKQKEGKKYFLSELWIDGERIEENTTFTADEIINEL